MGGHAEKRATLPPRPLRVLAIHAHPDDVEFQCAGTLALLARRGCRITIATMTAGDGGSAVHAPEEIAAIRRREAARAAAIIGADYVCLEMRDLLIDVTDDARRRVTEVVRRVCPDIIFAAPPADYLSDHEMAGRLTRDAAFAASVKNFDTMQPSPAPVTERIPHLYYVDSLEGVDMFGHPILPDFYVDVTETFQIKRRMLACHASQRDWLLAQHGVDEYLDSMEQWSRKRGGEIGVDHAEAFRQHRAHAFPHPNLLLKQLGTVPFFEERTAG